MKRHLRRAGLSFKCAVALAACVLLGGTGCDEETMAMLNGAIPGGGAGAADYFYGFTENYGDGTSNSFSLYPGSDPGESLETFLGGSVVY